jgi:hypothetical protein
MPSWSAAEFDSFTENGPERGRCSAPLPRLLLFGLTPPVFYYPGGFRLAAGYARDNPVYRAPAERDYALRRKSAALTLVRNCSGVSGSEVGAGAGFTAAGAAGFAAFFAALRAASFASCLAAKSFASHRPSDC